MLLKHAKPARRLQVSGRGPAQIQSGVNQLVAVASLATSEVHFIVFLVNVRATVRSSLPKVSGGIARRRYAMARKNGKLRLISAERRGAFCSLRDARANCHQVNSQPAR